MRLFSFFIGCTMVLTSCLQAQQSAQVIEIKAQHLQDLLQSNPSLQLVDVRTPGEYKKGHIAQAINIDWNGDAFKNHATALDTSKSLYIYCLSGARSQTAVDYLQDKGFDSIFVFSGGMMQWRNLGLPEMGNSNTSGGMSLADFQLLSQQGDKPVLIDVYAPWCAPCRKMKPFLTTIEQQHADKVKVLYINADEHPDLMKALNIETLPQLYLFNKGAQTWSHNGFIDENYLQRLITTLD